MLKTSILLVFLVPAIAAGGNLAKEARKLENALLDKLVKHGFSEELAKRQKSGKKKAVFVYSNSKKELVTVLKAVHSALDLTRHVISFKDLCTIDVANYAYAQRLEVKRDEKTCTQLQLPSKAPPDHAAEAMIEGLSDNLDDEPAFRAYDPIRRKLVGDKAKAAMPQWAAHYDLAEALYCAEGEEISPEKLKAAIETHLKTTIDASAIVKVADEKVEHKFEATLDKTKLIFSKTSAGGCLNVARETPFDEEEFDLTMCLVKPRCHFKGAQFVERDKQLRMLHRAMMVPQGDILSDVVGEMDVKSLDKIYKKAPKPIKDPVIVGVIDTGIDYNHPALAKYIARQINLKWFFPWLSKNLFKGFFDDEFPIDFYESSPYSVGYDLVHGDGTPFDQVEGEWHGTLVAGLIVPGTKRVQILPIKNDFDDPEKLIPLLELLIQQGVRLFNFSSVFNEQKDSASLLKLIQKYPEAIFVVASGNGDVDLNKNPLYPACFTEPNVITVSGATKAGKIETAYGNNCVDLAAWGVDVPGPCPIDDTCVETGSSFAAPFVTRAIALMMEKNRNITTDAVLKALAKNLKRTKELKEKTQMGGMLKSY